MRNTRSSPACCFAILATLALVGGVSTVRAIAGGAAKPSKAPDYARDVAPIFRKYCLGCHNAQEAQGGLVLESHAQVLRGGEHGAILVAGKAEQSRLIRVLEKKAKPTMPPEGNAAPNAGEIAILKIWIESGAKSSIAAAGTALALTVPRIEPNVEPRKPINALAYSPDGTLIAAGGYGNVTIFAAVGQTQLRALRELTATVNAVGFSSDGSLLYAASGEPGLFGELTLWSTIDWTRRQTLRGHRDTMLTAAMSPDGQLAATGSYDQTIRLWDISTGKEVRILSGHNGPVFDLAFDPTGRLLASASGDRTVKLWDVAKGERLDTFSQPLKEQYAVAFLPDGRHVIGGGVDSRIRVWKLSDTAKEGTNEIVESLFAHDGPILRLAASRDGRWIASSSEDRSIKVWGATHYEQAARFADESDWPTALAISPDSHSIAAGRIDGRWTVRSLAGLSAGPSHGTPPLDYAALPAIGPTAQPLVAMKETEPNDTPATANRLEVPGIVSGKLEGPGGRADVDYFRFHSKAGESWIVETEAARKGSPADTRIDVLRVDGAPIVRCLLRAVRDSEITFRPINSVQGGVRLENWREMDLNQFLYMSGEVCRLFRVPRGPDSEYDLYPAGGGRRCYFDTTAVDHALNEPVYIVEPYAPGTHLADNGLPVFPVYYSNDDDADRKLGRDSRLTFTAPADGDYLVRVTDTRGYSGPDFKYSLTVRRPTPDFAVAVNPRSLKVPIGGGERLVVSLDRIDDFEGAVRVDFSGAPPGYHVTSPLVIEQGHIEARGTIHADADARPASADAWKSLRITAMATIAGREVVKRLPPLEVTLGPPPKLVARLRPDPPGDGSSPEGIVIEPGQSVAALLQIERHGYQGELRFEVENLPHGVIVDNIGLNGIMVRAGENERQVFLTAARWVRPTERLIHAIADREGSQTSRPISLRLIARSP
ncbi:MAG TPA: c-type cytochrome domain-containing protein [Planctomycetaceae bacterium]|nr:c-type cytochrome domain-containing protein [Planctomycetaceae bacterium]